MPGRIGRRLVAPRHADVARIRARVQVHAQREVEARRGGGDGPRQVDNAGGHGRLLRAVRVRAEVDGGANTRAPQRCERDYCEVSQHCPNVTQ